MALERIFTRIGFRCSTGYKFDDVGDGDIDCIAFKEDPSLSYVKGKNIVPNESTYDRYRLPQLLTKKLHNRQIGR